MHLALSQDGYMVGIQYPMRAHLWTHGSSDSPALHTSHDFIPTSSCKDRDARRQTPGSRLPEKRRAVPKTACVRASRCQRPDLSIFPSSRPARWASDCMGLDWTGLDWIGVHWIAVSDRPCPTRGKKAPFSYSREAAHPTHRIAGYDRPAQVSREHKLSFSNQPSLDSLAREEKPTPTPPTQQQPRNACTHAPACSHKLAEQLTRTGCPRSDPSARSPADAAAASQDWNLLPTGSFPLPPIPQLALSQRRLTR